MVAILGLVFAGSCFLAVLLHVLHKLDNALRCIVQLRLGRILHVAPDNQLCTADQVENRGFEVVEVMAY